MTIIGIGLDTSTHVFANREATRNDEGVNASEARRSLCRQRAMKGLKCFDNARPWRW